MLEYLVLTQHPVVEVLVVPLALVVEFLVECLKWIPPHPFLSTFSFVEVDWDMFEGHSLSLEAGWGVYQISFGMPH